VLVSTRYRELYQKLKKNMSHQYNEMVIRVNDVNTEKAYILEVYCGDASIYPRKQRTVQSISLNRGCKSGTKHLYISSVVTFSTCTEQVTTYQKWI